MAAELRLQSVRSPRVANKSYWALVEQAFLHRPGASVRTFRFSANILRGGQLKNLGQGNVRPERMLRPPSIAIPPTLIIPLTPMRSFRQGTAAGLAWFVDAPVKPGRTHQLARPQLPKRSPSNASGDPTPLEASYDPAPLNDPLRGPFIPFPSRAPKT